MYNKNFKNTHSISFGTEYNVPTIVVIFHETDIRYGDSIYCYISLDTGEIMETPFTIIPD